MYGSRLSNEYINRLDAFIDFMKKDMVDNGRGFICCPCKHCKNEKKYHSDDVLRIKACIMAKYKRSGSLTFMVSRFLFSVATGLMQTRVS
jgi:hypothetical protein